MTDRIDRLHPMTLFVYFLCVMLPAMFCVNPLLQGISVLGALCFRTVIGGRREAKGWRWILILFLALLLLYPLFNHNGETVLFYINGSRITMEAVIYGAVTALMMAGILLWCRSLSVMMTSDRIIYLLGRISPKAALLCSMVLRFVPMFQKQMVKTWESQKLLGLYRENTLIDRVRARLYLFSAMVTWAFEHSMDTADSMQARGYGTGKRSQYMDMRMRSVDCLLTGSMLLPALFVLAVIGSGRMDMIFYPAMILPHFKLSGLAVYAAYLFLCLILPGYQLYGRVKRQIRSAKPQRSFGRRQSRKAS